MTSQMLAAVAGHRLFAECDQLIRISHPPRKTGATRTGT